MGLALFSCSTNTGNIEIEDMLIGNWTIDYLNFKQEQYFLPMSNIMNINMNNELYISGLENCKWELEITKENNFFIILNSLVPKYCDTLSLVFLKDNSHKLLKMKLSSNHFEMLSSKMLLNFDMNQKKIEEVVKLTKNK